MTETPPPYGSKPPPSGSEPRSDFESQYRRVLEAAGCETQTTLAAVLDIRQSSVSNARRRQNIPAEWLTKLFMKERINPEWVLTGQGGKTVRTTTDTAIPGAFKRAPQDCTTDELLAELMLRAMRAMAQADYS